MGLVIGVDASNIRTGGGVTHLTEVLRYADPSSHGIDKIIVWTSSPVLQQIDDRPWLIKLSDPVLENHYISRAKWQRGKLNTLLRDWGCHLLFVPGGSYAIKFSPVVTMSQNLLPFDQKELSRLGISRQRLKMHLLKLSQSRSFKRAEGTIFLTHYAKAQVLKSIGPLSGEVAIIPHGISQRFFIKPRPQHPAAVYNEAQPFRVIYISTIDTYKHQWYVVEAIGILRQAGLPVSLDLVGAAYPGPLRRLETSARQVDPQGCFIRYLGEIPYYKVHELYENANVCIFASTCETISMILMEGMASGLPVACSNCGPMPEVLGDAGVYFDPEDPSSIAVALRTLYESPELRARLSRASFERGQQFSWPRCARETMKFLAGVAIKHHNSSQVVT